MNRDAFFNRERKTRPVEVPDLGTVHVRKLSQGEVETLRKSYMASEKQAEGMRFMVAKCTLDESGNRIFQDNDLPKLIEIDFDVIKTIAEEVADFSGVKGRDPKGSSAD